MPKTPEFAPDARPLRGAVNELLHVEAQLAEADAILAEQKSDHKARCDALRRRRAQVLAELRGEGRQMPLDFDPETGEVRP